jgi:hypothetical protein
MRNCIFISMLLFAVQISEAQTVFFRENFDDVNFTQRGWYDNTSIPTTANEFRGTGGRAAEYKFLPGRTTPNGGAVRKLFTPSNSFYLSYWVKYSADYVGSGKPYHPHEFNVTTNLNDKYIGPASTKMTLYVEHNNGYPLLAFQDSQNIDTANIKKDLTAVTEARACAGCNGSGDAFPAGDCYQSGTSWRNGKQWKSIVRAFDNSGEYNKNEWHFIEAYFQLNSIANGKGIADGVAQYWFDGVQLINAQNVMFRTGTNQAMMFNQLLIAPYIGDGSPVEQTMWVDDLTVADSRVTTAVAGNNNEELLLNIYPVPADGYFAVDTKSMHDFRDVFLADILGNNMPETGAYFSSTIRYFSTNNLPDGVYFLHAIKNNQKFVRQIIVLH